MQCLKAWCIKLKHLGEGKAEEEISQIISYSMIPCFPCAERLSSKSQNVLKYIYIARIFLGCTLPGCLWMASSSMLGKQREILVIFPKIKNVAHVTQWWRLCECVTREGLR